MDSTTNAALNFALVQGRVDAEEYADIRAMACRRGDRALPFRPQHADSQRPDDEGRGPRNRDGVGEEAGGQQTPAGGMGTIVRMFECCEHK